MTGAGTTGPWIGEQRQCGLREGKCATCALSSVPCLDGLLARYVKLHIPWNTASEDYARTAEPDGNREEFKTNERVDSMQLEIPSDNGGNNRDRLGEYRCLQPTPRGVVAPR